MPSRHNAKQAEGLKSAMAGRYCARARATCAPASSAFGIPTIDVAAVNRGVLDALPLEEASPLGAGRVLLRGERAPPSSL